jgi:membrane protease YdiL (CAAX protease family)
MKKKALVITALLFVVSIGNYFSIISDGSIRSVEFLSIFAIGALAGVLLTMIFRGIKDKQI